MMGRYTYLKLTMILMIFLVVAVIPHSVCMADEEIKYETIEEIKLRPMPEALRHETEPKPDLTGREILSLEEAMDIAYRYNPSLRKVALELDRAEVLRDLAAQSITLLPTEDILVTPSGKAMINNFEQADINWKAKKKVSESEKQRIEKEVINAYAEAIKSANQIEIARRQLKDIKEQNRVHQVATVYGVMSNMDLNSSKIGVEQVEEGLKAAESAHEMAMSSLRNLLNQGPNWNPVLTSQPIADSFTRPEIWLSLSRAQNQSIMMLQAESLYEIEQRKIFWGLGPTEDDPYMDSINLVLRELDVEQARRDTRSTVESLYHNIDVVEKRIALAETILKQKEQDFQLAKLRYELGIIPYRSLNPTETSMASAQLAVDKAKLELVNLRADLVILRAGFGYLIGEQVYSNLDWYDPGQYKTVDRED
ncbi:MAG: TolC family protein [Syntrophomonadaceae bacterium]|nr:TolC family protein [Syntrophomonadaceae bacterium]